MNSGEQVYAQIQRAARADSSPGAAVPTQEYLTRHALESFLERLTRTEYADAIVLKGGLLLSVFGARRPTKDLDTNIAGENVSREILGEWVAAAASVQSDDGVVFELPALIRDIRDGADYPGFRLSMRAAIGRASVQVAWDVSTGDPIVPAPQFVVMERLVGEPFRALAYPKEAVIAEKGVTILERGIASTRWRDYVDIVQLAAGGFDKGLLLDSARAVARYREVELGPVAPHLLGYGEQMQAKWAAWRTRPGAPQSSELSLDVQVALVAAILDPVFSHGPAVATPPQVGVAGDNPLGFTLPGTRTRAKCTSKSGRHRTRSGAARCPVHKSKAN